MKKPADWRTQTARRVVWPAAFVALQGLALSAAAHDGHSPIGGVGHALEHLLWVVFPVAAAGAAMVLALARNRPG